MPNDADARDAFGDDDGRGLVEIDAAELLGDVGADQPEIAAAFDQIARDVPVLRFERVERAASLPASMKSQRRARDQPMLVGQALRA